MFHIFFKLLPQVCTQVLAILVSILNNFSQLNQIQTTQCSLTYTLQPSAVQRTAR